MMLPFLPGWTLAAKVIVPLVVVAAIAGGVLGYGHHRYKAGERAVEARYLEQRLKDEEADRRTEFRRGEITREVQDGYIKKEARTRAAAAATRTELDGLRSDLASLKVASAHSGAASSPDGAATVYELFGECGGRYSEVAEAADNASDRLAALQGWVLKVCRDAEPSSPAP